MKAPRLSARQSAPQLRTPDGRYLVVRGRLWRTTNPTLEELDRTEAVRALMTARRAVQIGRRKGDEGAVKAARADVDAAKRRLGERGPPWWTDGAPDFNRRLARNTPYAAWYACVAPCPEPKA